MKAPRTKKDNYVLYAKGEYGNQIANWDTLDAFLNDKSWSPDVPVALRLKSVPGAMPPNYCVPTMPKDVLALAELWEKEHGISRSLVCLNEIGPDDYIVIQGEVYRSCRGLELRYTRAKTIMRHAWKHHEENVWGLKALMLLRGTMSSTGFDNLERLLDKYEDGVVEFSVYSIPVGVLQQYEVFWEVRNY